MKKLVFLSLLITSSAFAENICVNSSGDSRMPGCNASNQLEVDVKDITPGTGATDLGKAEDAAAANGDTGVATLGRISTDGLGGTNSTNGDYAHPALNVRGAQFVDIDSGQVKALATNILKLEDAAAASGDALVAVGAVHQAGPNSAVNAGTTGDYGTLNANLTTGGLYVESLGSTATVCATLTPDTSAYAANDAVMGATVTDPISLPSLFRTNVNSGTITSVEVHNTEVDAIGWKVVLFDADPSTSTTTDQSGLTIADADLAKIVGVISVSDCTSFADNETCQAAGVNRPIDGAATGIYAALLTVGAPTWAAAQTVTLCVTAVQD